MTTNVRTTNARAASIRTWRFPQRLLGEQIWLACVVWLGFAVLVAGITAAIAYFDEIESSIWTEAATQAPRWFAAFIGIYVANTVVPRLIANGRTRRDCAIETVIFIAVYSLVLGALLTAGFPIERGVYSLMDWPQTVTSEHLFERATQYHLIFLTCWFTAMVWTAVGVFVGVGFYRADEGAILLLPLGLLPIVLVSFAVGENWGPFDGLIGDVFGNTRHVAAAFGLTFLASALTAAITWPLLRRMPLQNKTS